MTIADHTDAIKDLAARYASEATAQEALRDNPPDEDEPILWHPSWPRVQIENASWGETQGGEPRRHLVVQLRGRAGDGGGTLHRTYEVGNYDGFKMWEQGGSEVGVITVLRDLGFTIDEALAWSDDMEETLWRLHRRFVDIAKGAEYHVERAVAVHAAFRAYAEVTYATGEDELNMDLIVAALQKHHGIHAFVQQTGGGCATIYAGAVIDMHNGGYYEAAAGPGWFAGPGWSKPRASKHDFYVGPDDDGTADTYIGDGTEDEDRWAQLIASCIRTPEAFAVLVEESRRKYEARKQEVTA